MREGGSLYARTFVSHNESGDNDNVEHEVKIVLLEDADLEHRVTLESFLEGFRARGRKQD